MCTLTLKYIFEKYVLLTVHLTVGTFSPLKHILMTKNVLLLSYTWRRSCRYLILHANVKKCVVHSKCAVSFKWGMSDVWFRVSLWCAFTRVPRCMRVVLQTPEPTLMTFSYCMCKRNAIHSKQSHRLWAKCMIMYVWGCMSLPSGVVIF